MKILLTSDEHHHAWTAFSHRITGGMTNRFWEGMEVEDYVADIECDLRLRGGDLFDRKNVVDAVVFNETMHRLAGLKSPQLLLVGNHDHAAGGVRNSIEGFGYLPDTQIIDRPIERRFDDCVIFFVPYTGEAEKTKAAVAALEPHPGKCNILLAHTAVAGARQGSEYIIPEELTTDDLRPSAFDFVFLGHYHEPQWLLANTGYIGSLMQRSFADAGSPRRALRLDTITGKLEELPLPGPRFLVLHRNRPEDVTPQDRLLMAGNYIKITTNDPRISRTQWLDAVPFAPGSVDLPRGVVVMPQLVEAPQPAQVAGSITGTWGEHITSYVRRAETTLDRTRLISVGMNLVEEAGT